MPEDMTPEQFKQERLKDFEITDVNKNGLVDKMELLVCTTSWLLYTVSAYGLDYLNMAHKTVMDCSHSTRLINLSIYLAYIILNGRLAKTTFRVQGDITLVFFLETLLHLVFL